jgi:hypothetical protein
MALTTLANALAVYHAKGQHEAQKEGHIFRVWEDGEVSMTKCGVLLNQRNEHMQEAGFGKALPLWVMPEAYGSHGFVFCIDSRQAADIRDMIRAALFPPA